MRPVAGYAALRPAAPLTRWDFERRDLTGTDIAVKVSYVGVCHSDLDALRPGDRSPDSNFPLVAGHEFVGRATAVGDRVSKFEVGDAVAVGNIIDSCLECGPCLIGKEHFCDHYPTLTYGGVDRFGRRTQGAYATEYVVDEKFAYSLPPNLDPAGVAPLMCAGITTYSPLRRWKVGAGSVVGVVGVGGLGHLAVKLARAMGASVVGFTVNEEKAQKAMALGVDEVVIVTDDAAMNAQFRRFDFILDTVPVVHDIDFYLRALKIESALCSVGIVDQLRFDPINLIVGGKSIGGAGSGGTVETKEMLDFCSAHEIISEVEVLPIDAVNTALDRLSRAAVDYRLVLDVSMLGSN